ncbi:hypothetical protein AEA09_17985 [Lysinibacillus contaminans]|uniref:Acyltransferase 3 domain-containing protein n=1 Tax=Lysinibacillus contaminans TaxID=1293441 RepID=A0ABR5JWT8_9BACI|nr:acyltransferase [Lysinibacillus contaminans]KOS66627.1 hypothetical protein AEA09_17985 [Lysinibacillus contaminans]
MNSNLLINSLNGLRGIAVLIVVFSHTGNSGLYLLPGLNLTGIGQFGVILFFFLSAFLLSRPFFHKPELVYDTQKWLNYFIRRFLRIIPLYYIVVLLDFYFHNTQILPTDKQELIDHLLFIKGNGVYWSVPVELKFYLMLPIFIFLFIVCSKNKMAFRFLLIGILSLFISNAVFAYTNSFLENLFIHRYIIAFIAGVLTSYIYVQTEKNKLSLFNKKTFEIIAFACIALMITQIPSIRYYFQGGQNFNYSSMDWSEYYKYRHLFAVACFSVFTYCYLNGTGLINNFLSTKILSFIGELSFSMYLLHMPVLYFVVANFNINSNLQTLLVFIITILISTLTYNLIEKPFMNLSKKRSSVNKTQINIEQT